MGGGERNKYKCRPGVQVSRSRRKDSLADKHTSIPQPAPFRKACRRKDLLADKQNVYPSPAPFSEGVQVSRCPWQRACSSLPRVDSRLSLIRQLSVLLPHNSPFGCGWESRHSKSSLRSPGRSTAEAAFLCTQQLLQGRAPGNVWPGVWVWPSVWVWEHGIYHRRRRKQILGL